MQHLFKWSDFMLMSFDTCPTLWNGTLSSYGLILRFGVKYGVLSKNFMAVCVLIIAHKGLELALIWADARTLPLAETVHP